MSTGSRPDVFLSYSREDQATAKRYAEALKGAGFSVWWDQTLHTGENYDRVTEAALREAKAVVVLWSRASADSQWVRAEATSADRRGTLMPAMIEPCERPIMFELKHTAELSHWKGEKKDQAWQAFVADLRRLVQRAVPIEASPPTNVVAPPGASTMPDKGSRGRMVAIASVAALLVLAAAAGVFSWQRATNVKQARASVSAIAMLVDAGDVQAAFARALQARQYIPDDPLLMSLVPLFTSRYSVSTKPEGAKVSVRAYSAGKDEWRLLGVTPLNGIELPRLAQRWRIEKQGFDPVELATTAMSSRDLRSPNFTSDGEDILQVELKTVADLPADMVLVPGGSSAITRQLQPTAVPAFTIDRHEVTNAAYKEFVEAGGYERRSLWEGFDFRKDGRPISVDEAMRLFVDSTGRPGPAAWELGTYPQGRGSYPVSGVSWYEAMAYARFRGKSLPTAYHWLRAAMPGSELAVSLSASIAPASNYGTSGPAPVGQYQGLGPWGTYDMFGNVREWLVNPGARGGWMAGGSWEDPEYSYSDLVAMPLLDRSRANGFRLMKAVGGAADGASLQAVIDPNANSRDPTAAKPVSDEVYATYLPQFAYRTGAPNATAPVTMATTEDWIKQRVTIDTGYDGKRMDVILFVPRRANPPFQPIILFSGMQMFLFPATRESIEPGFAAMPLDYIVKSGRMLVQPIFEGTFERFKAPINFNDTVRLTRDYISWRWDLGRTIDYLATRTDVDANRIGYIGLSFGASAALPVVATEPRLKAAVFISGGIPPQIYPPMVDPVNFAPRIRIPVLMINGRYDPSFTVEGHQLPLYRWLGTPAADKRHVVFEYGHGSPPRGEVLRETLGWYDKYLGEVRQ
jgi:eukaryotic-like serine/threonine-protein kinase